MLADPATPPPGCNTSLSNVIAQQAVLKSWLPTVVGAPGGPQPPGRPRQPCLPTDRQRPRAPWAAHLSPATPACPHYPLI